MTVHPSRQARRRARQSVPAVSFHIDKLVLHGVAQADASILTAAFSDELARLAAQPASFSPRHNAELVAEPYAAGAPREVGRAVAASVWSGVRQQGRTR